MESLSFAATNLVKPGLQSRRQQSEPPNSRNVFPPTPPPENDRPAQPTRGASVRNGPKPVPSKLNLDRARPNDRYEKASPDEGQRPRPARAASANPTRGYSQRDAPRRRRSVEEEDAYPDLYDMYQGGSGSRNSRGQKSSRSGGNPRYIEEEEEGSDYEDASFDEGDFEMVSSNRRAPASVSGASRRSGSKRVVPTKVRIKVHAGDVRYIMVGMAIEFPDLVSSIQQKFGLRRRFKIKVKDDDSPDGDMITMGDQDDLDMIMSSVSDAAKKQKQDTGKLEVSLYLETLLVQIRKANTGFRSGLKKYRTTRLCTILRRLSCSHHLFPLLRTVVAHRSTEFGRHLCRPPALLHKIMRRRGVWLFGYLHLVRWLFGYCPANYQL